MHFNIYIDDQTGNELNRLAKTRHESRNALIREAIQAWVHHQIKPAWPEEVLAFKGVPDFPSFESYRDQFLPPKEDPLA